MIWDIGFTVVRVWVLGFGFTVENP